MRHLTAWVAALVILSSATLSSAARTRTVLDRVLPEMRFTGVSLGDCIDFIRDITGANIHVNWRALDAINVTRDTPVNIRVRSVTVQKALTLLLSDAGGGSERLAFYLEDGVIEITTQELADETLITLVYPVQDLLLEIPDFTSANSLNSNNNNSNNNSGWGSNNNSSNNAWGGGNNRNGQGGRTQGGRTQGSRADQLIRLITEIVRPDVWRQNGGPATIRFFNGNLIITAPRSVHEAIGGPID